MKTATKVYFALTTILAGAATTALWYARPLVSAAELGAIALFSVLAILAELLSFALSRRTRGSIAFIPYLAAILLAPSWAAVVSVVLLKIVIGAPGTARHKSIFNAVSHGLTLCCAIGAYLLLGGTGFLGLETKDLLVLTTQMAIPAIAAFATSFVVNQFVVAGVIAIDSGERIANILRASSLTTIGTDLMTAPIVFVFSWLYASFGPMAAAAAFVPIAGLRHLNRVQLELEETNEELLQLMVKSIEARDPYTSGHSRRVSRYAASIAQSLGLSQREVQQIATAALLHDVGKIYEKYAPILRNPGRLTPEEWATMQEHPVDGANLVSTISRLSALVPAVRHHHENWDGTGYPDRIAGNSIPLASRIIMFADTIDAMTSERPYRRALEEADVHAEIVRGRGKQFDPQIADRLLASGIWQTLFGNAAPRAVGARLALVPERETA